MCVYKECICIHVYKSDILNTRVYVYIYIYIDRERECV